ncbi:hypothetical protein EDC01DRAFT_756636 [Geopyxis carbonaria]|nr:hypothetical protein EDC01DRAFT_756636 [Geopyxis carbonaria]
MLFSKLLTMAVMASTSMVAYAKTYNTESIKRTHLGKISYGMIIFMANKSIVKLTLVLAAPAEIYQCQVPGTVALTFDDSPYKYTSGLLDLLESYDAKATFFVTGNNLEKGAIDNPSNGWDIILKDADKRGHQLGSHTWSHSDLSKLQKAAVRDEMLRLESAFVSILGKFPTYMRPPFSSCDYECTLVMEDLGYHITSFDLDTNDYNNAAPVNIQTSKNIVSAAIEGADPKAANFLYISHDIVEQSATNLTKFTLDLLKRKGFKAVTLGECLGDAPENWYREYSGSTIAGSSTTTSAFSSTEAAEIHSTLNPLASSGSKDTLNGTLTVPVTATSTLIRSTGTTTLQPGDSANTGTILMRPTITITKSPSTVTLIHTPTHTITITTKPPSSNKPFLTSNDSLQTSTSMSPKPIVQASRSAQMSPVAPISSAASSSFEPIASNTSIALVGTAPASSDYALPTGMGSYLGGNSTGISLSIPTDGLCNPPTPAPCRTQS